MIMKASERTLLLVAGRQCSRVALRLVKLVANVGFRVIIKMDCYAVLNALYEAISMDLLNTANMIRGMDGVEFPAAVKDKTFSVPVILLTELRYNCQS